jgi:hypothetical protein
VEVLSSILSTTGEQKVILKVPMLKDAHYLSYCHLLHTLFETEIHTRFCAVPKQVTLMLYLSL